MHDAEVAGLDSAFDENFPVRPPFAGRFGLDLERSAVEPLKIRSQLAEPGIEIQSAVAGYHPEPPVTLRAGQAPQAHGVRL